MVVLGSLLVAPVVVPSSHAFAKDYDARVSGIRCIDSTSILYEGDMTLREHYSAREGRKHVIQILQNNGFDDPKGASRSKKLPRVKIERATGGHYDLMIRVQNPDGKDIRRASFRFNPERARASYRDLADLEAQMPKSCSLYRGTKKQTFRRAVATSDIIERARELRFESAADRRTRLMRQSNIILEKGVDADDVYSLVTEARPVPQKLIMGMVPDTRREELKAREYVEAIEFEDDAIVGRIREIDTDRKGSISIEEMIQALGRVQDKFEFPGPAMLREYQDKLQHGTSKEKKPGMKGMRIVGQPT